MVQTGHIGVTHVAGTTFLQFLGSRFGFGFLRLSTSCVHAVVRGNDRDVITNESRTPGLADYAIDLSIRSSLMVFLGFRLGLGVPLVLRYLL